MSEYKPVGEVLPGVNIQDLPEGHLVVDCIIIIKSLTDEGDVSWQVRYTPKMSVVEAIGALDAVHGRERSHFNHHWTPSDDD